MNNARGVPDAGKEKPLTMNLRLSRHDLLKMSLASLVPALPQRVAAQTAGALRVATDPFDSYAEPYYAADLGMFKKAGLDVDVLTFANGSAITTAVAGGSADIGISNPAVLANAVAHGVPFTLIAGGGMYSTKAPTTAMCVAKASPYRTASDLSGKIIAVTGLKDILYAAAKAWLAQQGVSSSNIRFAELSFSEMGPALQRGTVDAAVIAEPALEAALKGGEARIFAKIYDVVAPQFLIGVWFSTKEFVQRRPDLVKKFVQVIYDSGRWANQNPAASGAILVKYAKLPAETTKDMNRVVYADTLSARLVQPMLDVAYKNGVLDKPVTFADMTAGGLQ
jgi:NitT/TauT family transport system substrate-binding protein